MSFSILPVKMGRFLSRNSILFPLFFFSIFLSWPFDSVAQIRLAWGANTEPDVAGYQVYYGRTSGNYKYSIDVGNVTTYTLQGLKQGVTYYIALTAYDSADNESDISNEVSGTITASSTRQYRLKVIASSSKNGAGVIESDDGLISCGDGGACMYNYDEGTTVILEAIPNEGSVFAKWTPTSLGCDTEPTCAVTMSKNITVNAKFQGPNKLKVKVVSKKGDSGTVTSNIPGLDGNPVDCPAILCQNYYSMNDTVTLTATPQGTSSFAGWKPSSLECGTNLSCDVPMDHTRNVQALFGP